MADSRHDERHAAAGLERMRERLRRVAAGEALAAGLAYSITGVLGVGLLDFLLRLPDWFRTGLLAAGLAALAWGVRVRLIPALRLRPKLSTLALRVERSTLGASNGLRGVLASGVALAGVGPSSDEPPAAEALRRQAAEAADERAAGLEPWRLISTRVLRHHVGSLAVVLLTAAVVAGVSPATAATGLRRVLLPLGGASWPNRFEVADATALEVHAAGSAVPVRALVTRTPRALGQTPVSVVYRIADDAGGSGPFRREPLSPQRLRSSLPDGTSGEAYERLLDPGLPGGLAPEGARLEYYLETPDDRTPLARVLLVNEPRIERVAARVSPPAYAAGLDGAWLSGENDLGDASGDRGLVSPVLEGSAVELEINMNKPAALADATPVRAVESGEPADGVASTADGPSLRIAWTAGEPARATLGLVDEHGLVSLEEAVVRIEVIPDAAPAAAVTDPPRDESVLATAVIPLEGEGRDDVGLAGVGLEYTRATVPGGAERSVGAEPEAEPEPTRLAWTETVLTRETVRAALDLSPLGLRPGDEVRVVAIARDVYEAGGVGHETVRSEPRRLRIIDQAELVDELLAELAGVRRAAIRLDGQQREIESRLREQPPDADLPREQSSIGESIDLAAETISGVTARADRNGLEEASLERVLTEAASAAERAATASQQTLESLADLTRGEPGAVESSARSAEATRRALGDLARALDRGEDSWAVRRALEGLIAEQEALTEQTADASSRTVGRAAAELTPAEQTVLDEIARRQLDLAERARELLDELDDRAEELAEKDRGQSAALRAASRRGREQGVPQQLDAASRAVAQNRGAEAGRSQQQAQEQLREMLRDVEEAERQRDEELRRALLSLVESIEALIRTQESELARLDAGEEGLDSGMASLHRNTLAALDTARADEATVAVAALLDEAAAAQAEAVTRLRAGLREEARESETRSLDRLRDALAEAETQLEDAERREAERRKRELQAAYRAALEAEVTLRAETGAIAPDRLTRRERATLRELGARQIAVRDALAALPAEYEELTDAGVFRLAHQKLDDGLGEAGEALGAGELPPSVTLRQDSAVRLLQGLIAALDDPESNQEDSFSQGGGGSGQGGQQGQPSLIPPLAELTLLRSIQGDLYDRTRAAEAAGDRGSAGPLGDEQRDLAEHAQALLERMAQQAGGGG